MSNDVLCIDDLIKQPMNDTTASELVKIASSMKNANLAIGNTCKNMGAIKEGIDDQERAEQLGAFMNVLGNEVATLKDGISIAEFSETLGYLHSAFQVMCTRYLELSAKLAEMISINKDMGAENQELMKRETIWKSLLNTSESMASSPTSRTEEIRQIASTIRRMSDAYGVTIFMLSESSLAPVITEGYGGIPREKANRWGAPSKEIVWIEDVRGDMRFDELDTNIITKVEFPLIVSESVIGTMEVAFTHQISRNEDFITTLVPAAASIASFMSSLNMNREARNSYQYLIYKFQEVAGIYHHETMAHLERVSKYCSMTAKWLGKSEQEQDDIALFSKVHDLGKIRVPAEITDKNGPLTDEEMAVMRKHTVWGADLIGNSKWLKMARNICLYHHERWDGTGYPFSMKGTRIPWEAQVVSIMDVYDALRSPRAYKAGFSHEETMHIIIVGDGRVMPSHFDPKLLEFMTENHIQLEKIYQQSIEYAGW